MKHSKISAEPDHCFRTPQSRVPLTPQNDIGNGEVNQFAARTFGLRSPLLQPRRRPSQIYQVGADSDGSERSRLLISDEVWIELDSAKLWRATVFPTSPEPLLDRRAASRDRDMPPRDSSGGFGWSQRPKPMSGRYCCISTTARVGSGSRRSSAPESRTATCQGLASMSCRAMPRFARRRHDPVSSRRMSHHLLAVSGLQHLSPTEGRKHFIRRPGAELPIESETSIPLIPTNSTPRPR